MLPDSWVLGVAWRAILVTGVRIVTSYVIAAMGQVVMWSLAAAYAHQDGLEYIVTKVTEETNISIDTIKMSILECVTSFIQMGLQYVISSYNLQHVQKAGME